MKITQIDSSANPLLKRVRSLHDRNGREKTGLFLLEGPKLLQEALDKDVDVVDLIVSETFLDSGNAIADWEQITVVDDRLFSDLYTTTTSCGIIATARAKTYTLDDCLMEAKTLIAVAESIQDPGNLGTMIRTALAFGATGLIATSGSVDAFNPKVVRSAMGALFSLPVITGLSIDKAVGALRNKGVKTVALEPTAKIPFWQTNMQVPLAFIFGNEGNGLSAQTISLVDELVTIPMAGAMESLNVAVSSGIVLFECGRQRAFA